jgi:cytochrome P450
MRRGMSQEECEAEGLLLVISGTESTASAIRSVLVHTITSPFVYNRLKAEIHEAVAHNKVSGIITLEEAKRLPYLQVGGSVLFSFSVT